MNDSVNTGGNAAIATGNMSFGSCGNNDEDGGTPKAKTKTQGLSIVGTNLTENKQEKDHKSSKKTRNEFMKARREALSDKF
jgi:hypothetical protein